MIMEQDRGDGAKVRVLIQKATNSTDSEVHPRLLKAIKSVVRSSDSELRVAAQTLMDLMKRDHSQVRYLSLLVIDELFMRSKLFRSLVVENLDQLLTLSVGFRRNVPLPAPAAVASILRSKAIEFLEKWNDSFGIYHRQLRLGYDYLRNILRFKFPNIQANAARRQQERMKRERRSKEILLSKFEMLKGNFSSIKEEIQSTLDEIRECLDIVHSKEDSKAMIPLDDDITEDFRPSELRQIRLDALKEGEIVHENNDNKVIFDALREVYKLMSKHLVSIKEWISVLVRVDSTDTRFRDSALREFIDIRNSLCAVKKRCEESGCTFTESANHDDKDEDFWEEGPVGATENGDSVACERKKEDLAMIGGSFTYERKNEDLVVAPTANVIKNAGTETISEAHVGKAVQNGEVGSSDSAPSLRNKLLADAPVIEWGSFLNTWDSKMDILANQRGLELESHWGRVDYDATIPAEKIAELNVRTSLYKEDQPEIQPCRAPLRKGGLCQRRDLRVCPFHGPIVPRDDEGRPFDTSSSLDETTPPDQEMGSVEKLVKQAVKNVRARDKEAAEKRERDKQALKRAKLAKIREHNEAVLRDAAVASTSRSSGLGECMETTGEMSGSAGNKKKTLALMLRKKTLTKDRISQRLLGIRSRDSTQRQLTLSQGANYGDAFPNQW
ncbi:UV-stimulated scaffold protein A homolog [Cucurbita maxima]|uniref:UV-stimulated scaffold protein A homolog n=1 Tax=Cucurbita maxima TaxID=3661 RepID=A0A6J1JP27_CUCMA|nr:UV-stimulated scaffold protein A homolog [Cucurbita maxima]